MLLRPGPVSTDFGRRMLDYLSPFGTFVSTATSADGVSITTPAHPVLVGSTDATLSSWMVSVHSFFAVPLGFTLLATVTGQPSQPVLAVRDGSTCVP